MVLLPISQVTTEVSTYLLVYWPFIYLLLWFVCSDILPYFTIGRFPWRSAWQPTPVFLPEESPWTEEPGGLQSMGSQRVGHDWASKHTHSQIARVLYVVCIQVPYQICFQIFSPSSWLSIFLVVFFDKQKFLTLMSD